MKPILSCIITLIIAAGCSSKVDFDLVIPPPPVVPSDLLLSEISTSINTDPNAGGTRPHYVELYNGTAGSIDLSNYAIGYMAVTDTNTLAPWAFPSSTYYFRLTGSLGTGKCYVIASPQADATAIKRDTVWGTTSSTNASASLPLQLSGNSAIALLKKDAAGTYTLESASYKIIDVFGSPEVGRATTQGSSSARNNIIWTVAGELRDTRNRTFQRKASVMSPTATWEAKGSSAGDSQWQLSGDRAWDYSNIGLPTP